MRTRSATTPHEARTAILAIWVWRVRRKRRKWRFSDLLLAAVSGTSHDRTAKTAKKAILAISVWRAYMPQWTANLTILARNSRKDSKARSAANQPLPSDWRFCKCGLVIPRWLPTRFAQTLIEESGEQNKKGDFGDHKIPSPPFTKPPLYHPKISVCLRFRNSERNEFGKPGFFASRNSVTMVVFRLFGVLTPDARRPARKDPLQGTEGQTDSCSSSGGFVQDNALHLFGLLLALEPPELQRRALYGPMPV